MIAAIYARKSTEQTGVADEQTVAVMLQRTYRKILPKKHR